MNEKTNALIKKFNKNLKNNEKTWVIIKDPSYVKQYGLRGYLTEIKLYDGSICSNYFIIAVVHIPGCYMDIGVPIDNIELYEEKENTEMKEVKGVNNKLIFIPKRINFRKKNDDYYTDVLWEDDTVTVVKLREGEDFDEYAAFCAALAKKVFGSTNAVNNIVKKTACHPLTKAQKKSIGRMKKSTKEERNHVTFDILRKEMERLAKNLERLSSDDSAE